MCPASSLAGESGGVVHESVSTQGDGFIEQESIDL